ncbi:MAG: transglycosylase domain-containing protein, partial [Sciscionella sp.]
MTDDSRDSGPRRRPESPQWPTGQDPDLVGMPQHDPYGAPNIERTGFYRPDFSDDTPPPRRQGQRQQPGQRTGIGNAFGQGGGRGQGRRHGLADGEETAVSGPPPRGPREGGPPGAQQPGTVQPSPARAPGPPGSGRRRVVPPYRPADDGMTEMLPLVTDEYHREPDLLTHGDDAEDDYPEADNADHGEAAGDPESRHDELAAKKKRRWRRIRRIGYVAAAVIILGPIIGFVIAYQVVSVPSPQSAVAKLAKPITYFYSDKSQLAKDTPAHGNRDLLKANQIPTVMKHSAEAAEDATFETNAGFDIKGILHAALKQVTGGSGGGSTITQQYIKQVTGNDQHSYIRKAVEVVKAYKMNREQSKSDILTAYLNTIYFGRGAYGVGAASQAYFGKNAKDLTQSEAALLGGLIQGPGLSEDSSYTHTRWNYVENQLLKNHWITKSQRHTATYPKVVPAATVKHSTITKKTAYLNFIENRVQQELAAKNLDLKQLQHAGAKIYTTIDPKAEQQMVDSVNKVMAKDRQHSKEITSAGVAADPSTGQVLAYYSPYGSGNNQSEYDLAGKLPHMPGSSFKPFTFLAAMEKDPGVGLGSTYNGTPGQTILGQHINNSEGETCGPNCTVKRGMTQSVNTVFANMAAQTGTGNVRTAALQAGIPAKEDIPACGGAVTSLVEFKKSNGTCKPGGAGIGISIGQYPVTVQDMVQAYSTFADNGTKMPLHFVTKVTDNEGNVLY